MDHLAYPDNASQPPMSIPYVCGEYASYDGGDFSTYTIRQGWASLEAPLGWLDCDDGELASRVQIWLFFGALTVFLDTPVDRSQFIRRDAVASLTTEPLRHLLERHRHAYQDVSSKHTQEYVDPRDVSTRLLMEATKNSEILERRVGVSEETLGLVSCSVRMLLQTLGTRKFKSVAKAGNPDTAPLTMTRLLGTHARPWKVPSPKALVSRLKAAGWCPARIHILSQNYSCAVMYYLSGLDRRYENAAHQKCTQHRCIAHQVDEGSYRPAHVNSSCDCSMAGICKEKLMAIIESGSTPLCSMSSDHDDEVEMKAAEPGDVYVALSHVWSGGLGNTKENAIATCQLRKITLLLGKLQRTFSWIDRVRHLCRKPRTWFWLDTLCIPVGEDTAAARTSSVDRMAAVYSGAQCVLALDSELQKIEGLKMPEERRLAHILCSSWMTRCWTLHESCLTQRSSVQFADCNVDLHFENRWVTQLWNKKVGLRARSEADHEILSEISEFVTNLGEASWTRTARSSMWSLKKQERHQAHAFAATWNNFLGRRSTKAEDLHRIFGAMQDFRSSSIRDLPLDDRMKAILKGHAMLPLSLLYVSSLGQNKDSRDSLERWVPSLPHMEGLDCSLGYLKVFSDYLLIERNFEITEEQRQHIRNSIGSSFEKFFINLVVKYGDSDRFLHRGYMVRPIDTLCFDVKTIAAGSRFTFDIPFHSKHGNETRTAWIECSGFSAWNLPTTHSVSRHVVIFPDLWALHTHADWYECGGSLFEVRSEDSVGLKLAYTSPLKVYGYDRSSTSSGLQTYHKLAAQIVPNERRLLVECDIDAWPAAEHFYSHPDSPLFSENAFFLYFYCFPLTQVPWPIAVVIGLAASPHLAVSRAGIGYCIVVKLALQTAELIWWYPTYAHMERQAWGEDFSQRTTEAINVHRFLTRYPSVILGLKRFIFGNVLVVLLLTMAYVYHNLGWARWAGITLGTELFLRTLCQILLMSLLPRLKTGRGLWASVDRWVTSMRKSLNRYRAGHVNFDRKRVPYRESLDIPLEYYVWG